MKASICCSSIKNGSALSKHNTRQITGSLASTVMTCLTAQYLQVLSKLFKSKIALDLTMVETLHETSVYLLR